MKFSKNGVGLAGFLVLAFGYFGIEIEVNSLVDLIAAAGLFYSAILQVLNQIERKDVKYGFFK